MKNNKIINFFGVCTFLVVLCLSVDVMAQREQVEEEAGIFKNLEVPLPDVPVFTKDEVIQEFKFVEEKAPSADPYSGFRMFIPKSWVQAPPELVKNFKQRNKLIGDVALFYSDLYAPVRSSISIEAYALQHNISVKNWMLTYLIDYGYLLEGIKEYDRNSVEVLATLFDVKDLDYKERIVAHINGDRVVMMKYSVPVPFWEDEKVYQATTARSFDLTLKDETTVNKILAYDLGGWAEIQYPETWQTSISADDSYDRISLNLVKVETSFYENDKDAYDAKTNNLMLASGLINVRLVLFENLGTTLVDELDLVKEQYTDLGFEIQKPLEYVTQLDYPPLTTVQNLEVYRVRNLEQSEAKFELWIASMKQENFYYIVSMLVADKEEQYFKWMENKSSFELLVSSFNLIPQSNF